MLLFIGIDDTDAKRKPFKGMGLGTGKIARIIAYELFRHGYRVLWVTRHQLLKSGALGSSNNSAKAVILDIDSLKDLSWVREVVIRILGDFSSLDSSPGVAINPSKFLPKEVVDLALRIRKMPITLDEVLKTSRMGGIELYCLRNQCSGVIGAFAASVLATLGTGRVLDIPSSNMRMRKQKVLSVKEINSLGIPAVKNMRGKELGSDELVYVDKLKPYLENFKPTLYVRRDSGLWRAITLD